MATTPADVVATQLFLIAANWEDYTAALQQDQERRTQRAAAYGVSVVIFLLFMASMHPPGLPDHVSNRPSGRRKKRSKPVRKPPEVELLGSLSRP